MIVKDAQPAHPWPHKHSHTFDLLFCRTMVSLGLSARQSDIFKDFTYLCLTWIKPFCERFADVSTNFEGIDSLPMMLFSFSYVSTRMVVESAKEKKKGSRKTLYSPQASDWLKPITTQHGEEATCLRMFRKNYHTQRQNDCACSVVFGLSRSD